MFAKNNYEKVYEEMMELLAEAEKENWKRWLEDTDIPASADDIPNLWVNRFDNYDPANDLKNFTGPFLSVLGETDDIVPYQEQIPQFKKIFREGKKTNYRIVVVKGAWHGMEHGPELRQFGYNRELSGRPFYYKFDRVAYGAVAEILDFLKEYNILD